MNDLLVNPFSEITPSEFQYRYFTDFADHHIKLMKSGAVLTKKKVKFSEDTIRQYVVSIQHFKDFENAFQFKAEINGISNKVLKAFEQYLISKNLALNSVSLYISKVKAIGNVLFSEDLAFRPVRFSTPKEVTTKVYLSFSEIKQIKECNSLTFGERKAFDVFIIQAFTGFRFSTLMEFLSNPLAHVREFEGNTYIDITSSKTGEQSIVPIGRVVGDILAKYNLEFPNFSERYMNKILKTICRKAGINNPVPKTATIKGERTTQIVEKWQMITTHTARRTLVSLGKQNGISDRSLMGITGHTSEKQLNEYNRTTKVEQVKDILGHQFFSLQI